MEVLVALFFVVVAVVTLVLLMFLVGSLFRRVGPNRALIVYGWGGTRIVTGGGKVVWPLFQNAQELSLELMSFDVAPEQALYTAQGVAVNVEAVAQIKVKSDPESIRTAAEQFLTKLQPDREALIRLVMEGHLRGIVGLLTVEQIVKEPEMVAGRVRQTVADDLSKMGLEVVSFTIKKVMDDKEYITNMGRPDGHSAIDVGPAWFGEAGVTDDSDFGVRHRVLVCCQAATLTPSCQSLHILWRPRRERPTDTG